MTKISEIHGPGGGIPVDEFQDRGKQVTTTGYVPYLSLTQGEMRLWLAAQRARLLAEWYGPEGRQYQEAATMLENVLNQGIMNGVHFIGAVPDYLQNTAALIVRASRQNRPAAVSGIMARRGYGIGAIIPVQDRFNACMDAAAKIPNAVQRQAAQAKCVRIAKKEQIINNNLVGMAPHMLYKNIPSGYSVPSAVDIHRTLHRLGVEGIAGVGNITDYELMYQWVENGILESNMKGGAGAIGSVQASFYLAPDPEQAWAKAKAFLEKQKMRPGVSGAHIGDPILAAIIGAVVAIVKHGISEALKYKTEIQKVEILAMSEAKGFGTPEYSASKDQWILSGQNPPTTAGGLDMTTLLLIGAGAYLLLNNDK